ncbi:MAG: hypothetical protein N2504_07390 [candidate division WOR-3 bacterium]|nr:hypothetical protein [candidate division WOR-3 bacterium]
MNEEWFDSSGNLIKDKIHEITIPEFKIFNSRFVGKPEDKFKTLFFISEVEDRKVELSLNARAKVLREFDSRIVVKRYIELYNSIYAPGF